RGRHGLEIYMMCEVPSNVVLAEKFADRFDGFSIGSNDLTQLILGVDRDSAELAELFDERNEAVKNVVREIIGAAHKAGCKVGIWCVPTITRAWLTRRNRWPRAKSAKTTLATRNPEACELMVALWLSARNLPAKNEASVLAAPSGVQSSVESKPLPFDYGNRSR